MQLTYEMTITEVRPFCFYSKFVLLTLLAFWLTPLYNHEIFILILVLHLQSGKILRSGEEAYIREAGDSCGRGEDPSIFGMKVIRQSTCTNFPPKPSNGNNKPSVALAIPPTGSSVATMPRLRPGKPAAPHRPAPPSLIPSFHDNSDPYWYRPVSTKPWKRIKTHSADSDRVNEIPSTAKSNSPLSWTFILTVCMLLQTALIK